MRQPGGGAEQRTANGTNAVLSTVRQQLAQLVRQFDSVPGTQTRHHVANSAVKYALYAVLALVDEMLQHVDDEAEEEATVYSILAEHLARELQLPEAAVFRAVIDLCAGPDPHVLTSGLPATDPRIAADLRALILRVMVSYDAPKTGPVTRTVELLYGGDQQGVKARRIQSVISRDDLPSDVRERLVREGVREIPFQLYPRRT